MSQIQIQTQIEKLEKQISQIWERLGVWNITELGILLLNNQLDVKYSELKKLQKQQLQSKRHILESSQR